MPRKARVAILMGSDSDLPVMADSVRILELYGVPYVVKVLSAHRSPDHAARFARGAEAAGFRVIICGAGAAAHLAGSVAAQTILPVIGVPLAGSPLGGFDSLLSTVQMPPGIPVATMGVGSMGAKNAGHLAVEILALSDAALRRKLRQRRGLMTNDVLEASTTVSAKLKKLLKA